MVIQAYYGTRKGGSGVRTIRTAEEAEKILKGGYSVTTVRLMDSESGALVGERWEQREGRTKWMWFYDQDYFK
jgi:hypothetical protein